MKWEKEEGLNKLRGRGGIYDTYLGVHTRRVVFVEQRCVFAASFSSICSAMVHGATVSSARVLLETI
eukprot:5133961-Pyramimonas_sp.AAC.1